MRILRRNLYACLHKCDSYFIMEVKYKLHDMNTKVAFRYTMKFDRNVNFDGSKGITGQSY